MIYTKTLKSPHPPPRRGGERILSFFCRGVRLPAALPKAGKQAGKYARLYNKQKIYHGDAEAQRKNIL